MEFATGALGTLLPKLGQLLQDEYNLQKGAKKDIQFLTRELESMHAALCIVGEVPREQVNDLVRTWGRDVREMSYDMEDIVDNFLVRVQGSEPPSEWSTKMFLQKMMNIWNTAMTRRGISQEIKDMKERVKEVAERRDRYKVEIESISPATTLDDPRIAALYTEATNLVGIDEAREEIIMRLTKGDDTVQQQRIVSIVGFGGLGKTTLAKAVYDKLKVQFDCTAFVSVSRRPDKQKVLKNILYELDKVTYKDIHSKMMDEELLINQAREFLQNKRYFIVIDDIWEPQSWETIKLALIMNNCGSRVIATTRNFDVAKVAGGIYKLQPLSYNYSKKLFHMRIFGGEAKCLDYQPDEVCDKFLKKCDGIPLAIITMASLLVGKPREIWPELYTSIGFGDKDNMHVENTMRILSFSYYDLPPHLKTCLLYLSAFPEDYVIDKDPLIWKWIAEGFVHKKQGKCLFEVGDGYFNDLINRSMIQAVESELDGIVEGCRLHDMVLDLISSISCEENFITIIDNGERTTSESRTRRLAYQNRTTYHTPGVNHTDMSHVRSVIAIRCDFDKLVSFCSFKHLRVLAIEDFQFTESVNLKHLGNLLQLRYLQLKEYSCRSRKDGLTCQLPEEIGALKFLQILDLDADAFEVLPSSIGLLTKLVCLRVHTFDVGIFDGIGKLTSLEELEIMPDKPDNSTRQFYKELGCMKELRVLHTCIPDGTDKSMTIDLMESLHNLQNIQNLVIYGPDRMASAHFDTDTWEAAGFFLPRHLRHLSFGRVSWLSRFPSYCINPSSLPNLSYLTLCVEAMDEQDLKLLGQMPELRFLCLEIEDMVSISNITAGDGYFRKLRFCRMHYSMVFFTTNEDLSVSFHIWSIYHGGMTFASRKNNGCRPAPVFMQNVEVIEFVAPVRHLKDGNGDWNNIGLEFLTSLQKIKVLVQCRGASDTEVEEVEAALKHAADAHPNRPTLHANRWVESLHNQEVGDDESTSGSEASTPCGSS